MRVEAGAESVTTLRSLVDALGLPTIRVLVAPQGLELRVGSTVQHDPTDEISIEPDAILLLVGTRADGQEAIAVARTAASCGYCAIVVKRRGGEISALITEASIQGIAVLAVADEMPWRHLDALLLAELGSQGVAPESGSAAGDELFAIANSIALKVGGSVAIEDMNRRVLAYSSVQNQRIDTIREKGILGRRVPEMERNLLQYRTVLAAPGVVRFPEKTDEFARSAVAIRAGSQPLGTIWAIEALDGLDGDGARILLEGAKLAALQILRTVNSSGLELQLRGASLLRALDGSLAGPEIAFRLSLPGASTLSLIGFATRSGAAESPLITHVANGIARYMFAYRPDASIATTSRAVYVLLPSGGEPAAQRFTAGVLDAMLKTFPQQLRAAIAGSSTDPADLAMMRSEIDDILRVTTAQPDLPDVALMADVHTRVLLAHFADELSHSPQLRHAGVDAMSTYDRDHGSDYGISVAAWLDSAAGVSEAAAALNIHPNTLRYRLRRVHELFGISLDHPDDRLSVWIQLRLLR